MLMIIVCEHFLNTDYMLIVLLFPLLILSVLFTMGSSNLTNMLQFPKKLIKTFLTYFTLLTNYSKYFVFDEILALRTFQKQPFRSVP